MKIKGFGEGKFSAVRSTSSAQLHKRLRLGSAGRGLPKTLPSFSTGSLTLDRATGQGGLARGTLSMIGGANLARNRALALSMVGAAQVGGGRVVVVDSTTHLWKALKGHAEIDEKRLAFLKCDNPVASLEAASKLVAAGKVDLVLLGPLAGAASGGTPATWLARNAALATTVRDQLTRLGNSVAASPTAVVVMHGGPSIASPISQIGRTQSILLDLASHGFLTRSVASTGSAKASADPIVGGGRFQVDVLGLNDERPSPAKVELRPGGGISVGGDLLEYGLADGTIERRGSVYKTSDGFSLGRGREAAKKTIEAFLATQAAARRAQMRRTQQSISSEDRSYDDVVMASAGADDFHALGPVITPYENPVESSEPKGRSLNTWFESFDDDLPPLRVGQLYQFKFEIARQKTTKKGGKASEFVEPDFGHHLSVPLIATLYSRDFEITQRHHQFLLDRVEDSGVMSTDVIPLSAGPGRIRLAISLQNELELLQAVRVEVEVVEAVDSVAHGSEGDAD